MQKPQDPVRLAVVGAAHGIKGELRLRTFTEDPLAIGSYGPLFTDDGRVLNVANARPSANAVIVRFREIGDRTAAEALTGQTLFIDRSALPDNLEEEEYYQEDLLDLLVVDEEGREIGRVVAMHDFGAGDILEIGPSAGATFMIPFSREAVPEIDVENQVIRIDSSAAGLGETEKTEKSGRRNRSSGGRK